MDIDVNMPDVGFSEVEVTEILVKIGDKITLEQGLITVESDKSSIEIPSSVTGIIKKINIKVGDKVKKSCLLMIIENNNISTNLSQEEENKLKNKNVLLEKTNSHVHATPFIRRLARKLDIDLHFVNASGPKNRILQKDLELYKNSNNFKDSINNNISSEHDSYLRNINKTKECELTSIQKNVGNNLYNNWRNIPHVTHFCEVDITLLEQFRQKYNQENNKSNNVTILVFIIKVIAYALKSFPYFNSSLSSDRRKIIVKQYINIGIAVDIPDGLIVPVLKNVDKKNILEISLDLKNVLKKVRDNTLDVLDTKDGGFTISNLGGIGSGFFSPIINSPEVAILGVAKSIIKPLWKNKKFVPALMLPLSLSYDHRVVNGADAARFMTFISKILSDMHFLMM